MVACSLDFKAKGFTLQQVLDDDTHQNLKTTGFVAREVHAKEEHDAGIQNLKVASFEAQVHDAETWALQVEKRMGQGGKDDVLRLRGVLDPAQRANGGRRGRAGRPGLRPGGRSA